MISQILAIPYLLLYVKMCHATALQSQHDLTNNLTITV